MDRKRSLTTAASVTWIWTWSGDCLGYLTGDDFWTADGRHIGKQQGVEIYDRHGVYVGDLRDENRLIFCSLKRQWYGLKFIPDRPCDPRRRLERLPALPMPQGHTDVVTADM
jgi:hypothetical protein